MRKKAVALCAGREFVCCIETDGNGYEITVLKSLAGELVPGETVHVDGKTLTIDRVENPDQKALDAADREMQWLEQHRRDKKSGKRLDLLRKAVRGMGKFLKVRCTEA